jgi:hypothetical protein
VNIKIDLDISAEELRKLMGLPDVQGFQEELLGKIREQMNAGAEGYDPQTLMRPFMNNAFASMDAMQKMMSGVMGMAAAQSGKKSGD